MGYNDTIMLHPVVEGVRGGGEFINNSDDKLHCDLRTTLLNSMMFKFICYDETLVNVERCSSSF